MFRSSKPIRSTPMKRLSSSLRGGPLKRSGKKQSEWKAFRDQKASRDQENGSYYCHHKYAYAHCESRDGPFDLHHLVGREVDPKLYFDESNLVWLCRLHHQEMHQKVA